jgi:large subunit ribosomal protein L13
VGSYLAKASRGKICWQVVDAEGWVLGRLAARSARVLTGKDSPRYTPHTDHRRGLIIINAEKVRMTGKKFEEKTYRHTTGYPGGLKEITARQLFERNPASLVREAIYGMLPKNRWRDRLARRLKVYAGSSHPHVAQAPQMVSLAR